MKISTNGIKTYSELITLPTFEERFKYLQLDGVVGEDTFGFDRYLNQQFYQSPEWRAIRRQIIIRDNGCDLGIEGRNIQTRIIIHHLNPITKDDILRMSDMVTNPEYLICTCKRTHDAIHYGDDNLIIKDPIERSKNDTSPWRQDRGGL